MTNNKVQLKNKDFVKNDDVIKKSDVIKKFLIPYWIITKCQISNR